MIERDVANPAVVSVPRDRYLSVCFGYDATSCVQIFPATSGLLRTVISWSRGLIAGEMWPRFSPGPVNARAR